MQGFSTSAGDMVPRENALVGVAVCSVMAGKTKVERVKGIEPSLPTSWFRVVWNGLFHWAIQ
jgi:hypothetical protein